MSEDMNTTVKGEATSDWRDRMRKEYQETKNRYNKLHEAIVKIEAGTCKSNCRLELLKAQAKAMGEYLYILEVRAEIEGIYLFM